MSEVNFNLHFDANKLNAIENTLKDLKVRLIALRGYL